MIELLIDPIFKVIEQQGIIAGLLLVQMWKNSIERRELLAKNCELNRFIMSCFERKLIEDGLPSESSPASPKSLNFNDLPSEGIITHPTSKVS
jgi:hypothetical protein